MSFLQRAGPKNGARSSTTKLLRLLFKKKLLGSIFTEKLIIEDGNYRTTGLNEAIALIGKF